MHCYSCFADSIRYSYVICECIQFYFFFPIFASLISFSYFVELSNAFRTVLNGNSGAGRPSSALKGQ